MHPAEFCEQYIKASLCIIFLSNSTLALLLGIPYNEQSRKRVLNPDQPIFGQGEIVQVITSSTTVVLIFCLFLCGTRLVPCCRFKLSKVIVFVTLAALCTLGACCLTTYGGVNKYCESDGSQNPKCYRRPDLDLPLTWFSVAVALTGVVASFVLHLYDGAAHTWPRKDNDKPQSTRRDSLELVKMQRSSNGNDTTECQEEGYCPPPPYESSTAPLSSHTLPSIPMRKREMNKLGLTVITDVQMYLTFEFRPLEIEPSKRRRSRGRDVLERKPLGVSVKPQRK